MLDYKERKKFLVRYVNRKTRLKTIHDKAEQHVQYMNNIDYSKYHRLARRMDEDKLDSYKDRLTNVSNDAKKRLSEIKPLINSVSDTRQRKFLSMRYIDCYTVDEIALIENCSHNMVVTVVRDGIKNIVE